MPLTTTLNRIGAYALCPDGQARLSRLLSALGKTETDDEPLPYAWIVEITGFEDTLAACPIEPRYAKKWRLFAIWCARRVERLMDDPRSKAALVVAERYANGDATRKELQAAWEAAYFAEKCSDDISASYAAMSARGAARRDAPLAARDSALYAMEAAEWADVDDVNAARRERAAQKAKFLEIVRA